MEGSPLHHSSERHCVPMVFYTKHVWKPGGKGKGLLGIQVCLVEQCSSIIEVYDNDVKFCKQRLYIQQCKDTYIKA